ncbi:MAG TPA: hypothetical protein VKB57_16075, partial [Acidimicrobiales bacterium]|nr:hypothetical protein [Acidimicrobiales bacterium]
MSIRPTPASNSWGGGFGTGPGGGAVDRSRAVRCQYAAWCVRARDLDDVLPVGPERRRLVVDLDGDPRPAI